VPHQGLRGGGGCQFSGSGKGYQKMCVAYLSGPRWVVVYRMAHCAKGKNTSEITVENHKFGMSNDNLQLHMRGKIKC